MFRKTNKYDVRNQARRSNIDPSNVAIARVNKKSSGTFYIEAGISQNHNANNRLWNKLSRIIDDYCYRD